MDDSQIVAVPKQSFFSEQHKKHVKWSERLIAKLCVKQSAWASVSTSKNFNDEPLLS